ncbi:hypothetical protein V8B55DRAFT_1477148 [Mucor lusitanicus]|nr:hypothetical protein FB192DRAFT_1376347 [Mucor lusitanicus]
MSSKHTNSPSISETTRKVFFISNSSKKYPSTLFVPALITAKGLYPPSIVLLKALLNTNNISHPRNTMMPRKSYSVPIKLITMQEHSTSTVITKTTTTTTTTTMKAELPLQKSQSTPSSPTTASSESQPHELITVEKTVINTTKTSRKPMKHWVLKKKSTTANTSQQTSNLKADEDEEDEPMTKPMSLTEKRKRQAKRADQVKIWKVREEREAREARLVIRRQIVNGTNKKTTQPSSTSSTTNTIRKKKKRVKFNFDKNSVIELPSFHDNDLEDI